MTYDPSIPLSPFTTVVVPFPFSDRQATRRRPALVVSSEAFNSSHEVAVLAMITAARRSSWSSDVPITDLDAAHLNVPSVVRLKLFSIDVGLVDRILGKLSTDDATSVQTMLTSNLGIGLAG